MEERVISLQKGREISLEKGIKSLKVSVTWDENRRKNNLNEDFDVDLIILELDENGRCLSPDHLVFYGSFELTEDGKFTDPERAVIHSGDDRDGSGEGEECVVNFSKVNRQATKLLFLININEAVKRGQKFDMIKNTEVKAYVDGKETPKLVYRLDESYGDYTSIIFCSVDREGANNWRFSALGDGSKGTLFSLLRGYGLRFKESDI